MNSDGRNPILCALGYKVKIRRCVGHHTSLGRDLEFELMKCPIMQLSSLLMKMINAHWDEPRM